MKRNGQAAMEFLMTYGWAILVVLAAIGALAYFGVLAPDKFLPEKCTLPPGLACLDSKITNSSVEFIIQNSLGRDITINSITIGNCTENYNLDFENGAEGNFIIICETAATGSKFKEDLIIDYTNKDTGMQKISVGDMVGKVQ